MGAVDGQNPAREAVAGGEPACIRLRHRGRRWRMNICTKWSMRWMRLPKRRERAVPQVALNWLLQRPSVSTVILGARNEEQLKQNLAAEGWNLSGEQVAKLDAASDVTAVYPYWHQWQFTERNPRPVPVPEKAAV
jgi:predicted aldo/keto reductase-like oxidoreductase